MQHRLNNRTRTLIVEGRPAARAVRRVAAGLVKPSLAMGFDLSASTRGLAERPAGHSSFDRVSGAETRRFPATAVRRP